MRLELLREAAATHLPQVLAERCVHSLIEQASCQRCVDACPTAAWVIDDERLGIDPARCDGCGLCAPACPQAAIVARSVDPLRVGPSSGSGLPAATDGTAMLACDHAFPGRSGFQAAIPNRDTNVAPTRSKSASDPAPGATPSGIAPCIHALGLRDLARLAAAGCTRLVVSTGNCDTCPRGNVIRLENRLADLARLLDSRGLPILRIERLPPDRWQDARDAAAPDPGPAIARRAFLRRGLGLAIDQAAGAFGLAAAERRGIETVACLLPDTGQPGTLAPIAPCIDPVACTGCDACARLCAQQAIRLDRPGGAVGPNEAADAKVGAELRDPGSANPGAGSAGGGHAQTRPGQTAPKGSSVYRILPEHCTGCGVCVDVCADRAVRLEAWPPAAPVEVPLAEATCTRCRVRFHRPVIDWAEGRVRCPICAHRSGTDRLFRLQE